VEATFTVSLHALSEDMWSWSLVAISLYEIHARFSAWLFLASLQYTHSGVDYRRRISRLEIEGGDGVWNQWNMNELEQYGKQNDV
jgi:hypothetical protein